MILARFQMLPLQFFIGVIAIVGSGIVAMVVVAIILVMHRRRRP